MEPASLVLHQQPQGILTLAEQIGSKDEILDLTVIPPLVRAGEGRWSSESRSRCPNHGGPHEACARRRRQITP